MANTKLKLASTLLAAFALASCSSANKEVVNYIQGNEQELYKTAITDINSSDYTKAQNILTQLQLQYPFGNYKQKVSVMQAYVSYKTKNYQLASAQISQYLQENQASPMYFDYMLTIHALASISANRTIFQNLFNTSYANVDLDGVNKAITDLVQLMTVYPNSPYTPYGKELLNYLRGAIATHNLNVAKFYLKYNNPVAAYRRANIVIANFPASDYAQQALNLMQSATNQLKLTKYQQEIDSIRQTLKTLTPEKSVTKLPELKDQLPPFLEKPASTKADNMTDTAKVEAAKVETAAKTVTSSAKNVVNTAKNSVK